MEFWGDTIKNFVDPFDITGQDAAKQASKDNAANLATQTTLAQNAQDFFKQQSDLGIAGIQQASTGAQGALTGGLADASGQLAAGQTGAAGALAAGQGNALGSLAGGYNQGRTDVFSGYGQGRSDLASAYDQARGDLSRVQGLQGFTGQATNAINSADAYGQSMLAQPGGLYAGFEQDPGYQFRLKQGEEAINRQAAAQGGRGGGATMKALADYNQGLASQEYGNFAQRQQAAAGLQSGYLQSQAARQDAAQLAAQGNAMGLAGMGYGAQGQLAGMASQYGQSRAGLSAAGGNALGNMATEGAAARAGIQSQYGQDLAGLNERTAATQAGMTFGTGSSLADLIYGTGTDVANIGIGVGAQGVSTSQSLMGAYNDALNNQQAINQQSQDNKKETAGMIASIFSDRRLKAGIETVPGSKYERIGLRGVRWTWKPGNALDLVGYGEGVIAQEVLRKYPSAVGVRGDWFVVDYGELDRLIAESP